MTKVYKKFAVLLIFAIFITILPFSSSVVQATGGSETKPKIMIRVGLYYGNTGVSVFNVTAEKGLDIGFEKDGSFSVLAVVPAGNRITVRKDTYYVFSDKTFREYDPSSPNIPDGTKKGPYHIKIGQDLKDPESVQTKINELREKGIDAYPAFADTWQVWTGFYTSEKEAQEEMDKITAEKLKDESCAIIQPSSGGIIICGEGDAVLLAFAGKESRLQIYPGKENDPCIFRIGNSGYRGGLEVRRYADSDMTVINILDLEEYLYSVVPSELEASAHPEALKAQAIVARTYALNNMNAYKKWGFDVDPTTRFQVYKGYNNEHPATTKAVKDTSGLVVMHNGSRAQVYFFASSGGWTEASRNVWVADLPYLQSVEDKYESGNSYLYNWKVTLTAERVREILQGRGNDIGQVLGMEITKTSEVGRAVELVIKGAKGNAAFQKSGCRDVFSLPSQWYTISTDSDIAVIKSITGEKETDKGNIQADIVESQLSGKKVITSEGLKTLKSENNKVVIMGADGVKKEVPLVPTEYTFTGKGWGHAVGMSQEGAKGMANAGFKYDEIIRHYFPGTTIETVK